MSKEIFILTDGYYIKCTIYFLNICLPGFGREFALAIFADIIKNPSYK